MEKIGKTDLLLPLIVNKDKEMSVGLIELLFLFMVILNLIILSWWEKDKESARERVKTLEEEKGELEEKVKAWVKWSGK